MKKLSKEVIEATKEWSEFFIYIIGVITYLSMMVFFYTCSHHINEILDFLVVKMGYGN